VRLEQLQAFLAIAETGSFQQAALQSGLSQSAVSRQIQALESSLGIALLHRTTPAKLTVGGERFLLRARKMVQEWHHAVQDLADLQAGKQSELCVAVIHSVCSHYLPSILQHFYQAYPDIRLRITALGSDRALKVLKDGLVDLAIVMNNRFLTMSPEMVVDVLYDEPIKVLMAANHPLTQFSEVPWQALTDYPQVVFKDGYGMQRMVQEQFARRGSTFQAALELNTPDAFRGVVRQGTMIALLPESALIDAYADPTLEVRAIASRQTADNTLIDPPLTRQVVVVTSCDRLLIPPVDYFYQLVIKHLSGFTPLRAASKSGEYSN
jgi:DNA-binding transcriptional LysR family regulator